MGLFRRKRQDDEALDDAAIDDGLAEHDEPTPASASGPTRPQGPWDSADAPDAPGVQQLDLGGMRVPVQPETEVRVELSPERKVVAATLVRGASAMQVSAFAAPRTDGIWAEIREEIVSSLREGGGSAEETEGPFGPEITAAVPTQVPNQGRVLMPARFLGVDGPRWFVRALLTGPAATEPGADADLLAALRGVVVVRGTDPMAVRDPLPMQLPKAVADAAAAEQQASAPAVPGVPGVPERGPEITEIR